MTKDDFLDTISLASFLIGLENLQENVDQSTLQDVTGDAVNKIKTHLTEQDTKIDYIISLLRGEV